MISNINFRAQGLRLQDKLRISYFLQELHERVRAEVQRRKALSPEERAEEEKRRRTRGTAATTSVEQFKP